MLVYLTPFFYVIVLGALYLYAPEDRRELVRKNLLSKPNFYLICALVLILLSIWADSMAFKNRYWLAVLTWLISLILTAISVKRALQIPVEEEKPEDPLNRR